MDSDFLSKFQLPIENDSNEEPHPRILGEYFEPSPKDIICGRGKMGNNHPGNRRFRIAVAMNLKAYVQAKNRPDKSKVVSQLAGCLREGNPTTGAFVKFDETTGRWTTLDDQAVRDKVSHALRDAFASARRNSFSDSKAEPVLMQAQQAILRSSTSSICRARSTTPPNIIMSKSA